MEFLPILRYFSFEFQLQKFLNSSFTDPNDSKAESESNFLASYMMEVEDDNVYIGRMTTNVSGDSGLDGQSEETFYGLAEMDVLLFKYYELQIRILTSGTSEIVKLTEESAKYTLIKTGMLNILL